MLHEYKVRIPYKEVENYIEVLNEGGIFNLYYESPIENIKVKNGYAIEEKPDEEIELHIYADETENRNIFYLLKEYLNVSEDQIKYQIIADNITAPTLTDIDLKNGWVISYPNFEREYPNQKVLKFDPQAAFGTGLHETTQDCLRFILDQDFSEKNVLDLGTGSGILTIAASLKSAKEVVAVDIEPVAREMLHNQTLNELANTIHVLQTDLLDGDYFIHDDYDWIFLNIGADESIKIIERHELFKKASKFLISGLVEWNIDELIGYFLKHEFKVAKKLQTNEWVTLYFIHQNL